MLLATTFILLFSSFYSIKVLNGKNPLFFYSIIWLIILSFYNLKLFNINSISFNTEVIIFLSVISFIFGYLVVFYILNKKANNYLDPIDSSINIKYIKILIVVLILSSSSFYFNQLINLLRGGTILSNKEAMVIGEVESGVIMQYFVRPFEFIIMTISAYFLVKNRKEKFIILSGIYILIMKFLGTGSKSTFIYYIFSLILSYYLFKSNVKLSKNIKRKIWIIILISSVFLLIYMARTNNLIETMYFYICGSIPMLDSVINTNNYNYLGNTLGFLSFNGIIRFLIKLMSVIGISMKSTLFENANSYLSKFEYTTYVSPTKTYNAFMTYISNFYLDFGVIGVIIFSILFGMVACYIYLNFIRKKDLYNMILLVLINYFIIMSMVRFQLSNTIMALTFLYAIFLKIIMKKIKIKI